MSKSDKGVLIFAEWFEAMSHLNQKDFYALMNAIYNLQIHGEEPPEFKGKAALVGGIIFPYIRRRSASNKPIKKSAAVHHPAYGINPYIDEILEKRSQDTAGNGGGES